MDMYDPPIAPPYASMVIVEMFYRDIDEQYFVRFSYRNETDHDPYVLKIMGVCNEFCPLTKFNDLTKNIRPKNWAAECQAGMPARDDPTIWLITEFSMAVCGLLLILLVVSVIVSCCYRRDRNAALSGNKYQSVNQDFR